MKLGRHIGALDALIDSVRSGHGISLVVRGEPGSGKTTLLDEALLPSADHRVVRIAGVEEEQDLGLGAVHRLCEQLLGGLEQLPDRQAEALRAAFGLDVAGTADRLLLGLAVRGLLVEAARTRPLVCVIDDAQWLDGPSARTLAFVARRLDALPLSMVFASRDLRPELHGLPDIEIENLSHAEARQLIDLLVPGACDDEVRARLVSETEGNPVAIAALWSQVQPEAIAGGFGPPGAIGLPADMEADCLERLGRLPEETRRLLVVAAAEPLGRPGLLWRAAEVLGISPAALDPAEEAGLLRLEAIVRFRHPGLRSLVYRSASPERRREAHRALAEATDREVDPDRHAWHRGEGADEPDEEAADELMRAVDAAQDRGGLAATAAVLERAASLTSDPARRSARILATAEAKFAAGAPAQALGLLARAEPRLLGEREGARVADLLTRASVVQHGVCDPVTLLTGAARWLDPLDARLARDSHLGGFEAAIQGGHLSDQVAVARSAVAVRTALPVPAIPHADDLLLDGLAALLGDGHAAAAPVLRRALGHLESGDSGWLALGAGLAVDLWADGTARALANRQRELALRDGALADLHPALTTLALLAIHSGDLAGAVDLIDRASAITPATAIPDALPARLMLAAYRGRETETSELARATTERATARGEGRTVAFAEEMSAVVQNGLGNYPVALAAAQRATEYAELGVSDRALAELVEAAARCGELQTGEAALRQLSERTAASGTDWALGVEARSRALLSEGREADEHYRIAIERLGRSSVTTALARAHLVYGEWLRREGRRTEAREQLRVSLALFTDMGADAFAERAERALLATGERLSKRGTDVRDVLTSQEAQISQLARDGHSNPEIAAKLYISPRTVEYHLTKVFTKLGISSRNQLHRVLRESEGSSLQPGLGARLASGS